MKRKKKAKKMAKGFKIFLCIFLSLCLLSVACLGAGFYYFKKNFDYQYNEITEEPEDLGFEEVKEEKIINIALFGLDTRAVGSFSGRSDSIMILSLDKKNKKVKLISVLRDTLVPIDKDGKTVYNKINSAYATGGPELAIKTLNTIFNLDISEYASVNFYGMADIIDGVGGIDVEVTAAEIPSINGSARDHCKKLGIPYECPDITGAGMQHLNGIQAVAYSRIRYVPNAQGTSNDYGRTDRQRYVMKQLFNKAIKFDMTQIVNLAKALAPHCETSLSHAEIIKHALDILLHSPTIEETRVPFTEYLMKAPAAGVGSVVYYDLQFATKLIHSFIYDGIKPEDYIAANGIEKNDWYTSGFITP